jgi:DNA-binding response OmpR family regulator
MNHNASGPTKILAVDDDASFLGLISAALANENVAILSASDAEQGMELFYRERPRIVLLDLVMPGTGGMELLEGMLSTRGQK